MVRQRSTELTPAGQRLLDAASALFYRHGIRAVGVEAIAEAAGTTKKTLYDRFGSKDALVALYLGRRFERSRVFTAVYLDEHAPDPGPGRVLAVYDALAEWQHEDERGCAFVNAYAEIGGTEHPGVAVIRAENEWIRALYTRLVTEAGLDDPGEAAELGLRLTLLHEGALVTMTAGGVPDAIAHARDTAADLLELALRT
ncbi:TetR/AcrR family transcriptional regulator [Jiangella anatolica]|uniref:TetR/AcrR family transcriptional regulator n=1 Tax=Jiangella anatolica TaxID=2670374 RepID=A0A2W2BUB2_9ACTN|nr:TetR/AcrR family transcriptional regulator [Jiangella anatolica]PZF79699.1 TetR/AcrR family transcriptional regulator [Jiangella anatolica]